MDSVKQKILDDFDMLCAWDPHKKPSKLRQLINAAKSASEGIRHKLKSRSLCSDDIHDKKLMDIFQTTLLEQKSFNDETIPIGGYMSWRKSDDLCEVTQYSYAISTGKEYLVFDLYRECHFLTVCTYYKNLPKHRRQLTVYPMQYVCGLIDYKLLTYKKHADKIMSEQKVAADRMKELQNNLTSAAAADALMSILGLSMDTKSRNKVKSWKDEAEKLTKEL